MIKRIIFPGLFILIILIGCSKNKNKEFSSTLFLNDTVQISPIETLYNYNENISFSLDSIINDSRCPSNVTCIWEGNAEVKFRFSLNNIETNFTLHTNGGFNFNTDTIIDNYKIELINLYPYPEDPGIIPQHDYVTEILITNN